MVAGHLDIAKMPTEFRVVPDDAPVLLEVLEDLHHELQLNSDELSNAWGAIIISENQDGLRRFDIAIFWDAVVTDNGIVQFGDDGEVLPRWIYLTEVPDTENPELLELVEVELNEDGEYVLNGEVVETVNNPARTTSHG